MPVFPRKEAKILELARKLTGGMKTETENLSRLPVSESELSGLLERFAENGYQITRLEAELKRLYVEKKGILKQIVRAMKRNLGMLALIFKDDAVRLARYGWAARRPRTPSRLPGQPRVFEALTQGTDWFDADWKPPLEGGKVKFYTIMRRIEGETEWRQIGSFFETRARIKDQPRKVDMQFRVIAGNRAGEGLPSNTINVVL